MCTDQPIAVKLFLASLRFFFLGEKPSSFPPNSGFRFSKGNLPVTLILVHPPLLLLLLADSDVSIKG